MQSRFIKLDAQAGTLPAEAKEHAIVAEPARGLQWAAQLLCDGRRVKHKGAMEAAAACRLGGFTDWRLPTVEELFVLADRSRFDPAIDTDAFPNTPPNFHWASTPVAEDPEYAWGVYFNNGDSYIDHRDYNHGFVRACRSVVPSPGQ